MLSVICALSAAVCSSSANLLFRKNSVKVKTNNNLSINSYLMFYYLCCFTLAITFTPNIFSTPPKLIMILLGSCVGTFNVIIMQLISQALKKGPAGLTFAFQNSSSLIPGIILFWIFGGNYGYSITFWHMLGILLILIGLFIGTREKNCGNSIISLGWFKYVLACFIIQICSLTLLQGRCVLFECTDQFPFAVSPSDDVWLLPGQFGTCLIIQTILFISEKREPQTKDLVYGIFGGFANFAAASLLLLATRSALPGEKGMLLPCFAISTIILCNMWANKIYQERFKFTSNMTCAAGIVIGSIS